MITRELSIPAVNSSVRAVRDDLRPGNDVLWGEGAGSAAGAPGALDDVIFGDYGIVTQDISHASVGLAAGTGGGYIRPLARPQRIQTTHRVQVVETTRFADGGVDTIYGEAGDDFILGGAKGDVIDGGGGSNVVFGDHGRISGQVDPTIYNRPIGPGVPPRDTYPITTLELVESLVPAGEQGGDDMITTGLGRDMIFGGAGADTIVANFGEILTGPNQALDGNNIVFGDYGFVDYLLRNSTIADDAHDIEVISSIPTATNLGGDDIIVTGNGNDIVMGGAKSDTISAGQGKNLVFGDNARLATNPELPDGHISSFAVHEFLICVIETLGFADEDGGHDTLFGGDGNDILFGGAGNDVIYGFGGNDLIFGDHGRVSCTTKPYDPDDPSNGVCVDLGGTIDFRATNTGTNTGTGDDLIYAGAGNDIVMGQQGNDIIYGEDGDDILIGGSNVSGALDGDDVIDGGAGNDLIAGDNAECCYRNDRIDPRMRALAGTVIYGTTIGTNDGVVLVTGTAQNDPTGIQQYRITLLDHSDSIQLQSDPRARFWGHDFLAGGPGSDEIYGELGNDTIQGDGAVNGLVLKVPAGYVADGFWYRLTSGGRLIGATDAWPSIKTRAEGVVGAWRDNPLDQTVTETLVVHPSTELATDGDDYIEGNGGRDIIFGNLGQDDIVGDSSDLFGLGDNQRLMLSQKVAGATTFLKDAAGKVVEWRVISLSTDGLTLTLDGTAAGLTSSTKTLTIQGAGIQDPIVVGVAVGSGTIALTATIPWRTVGSFCLGPECRPADGDMIFGGAGTPADTARNAPGDATIGGDGSIVTIATGHARDADVIAGDNADIFRLVGTGGVQKTPNAYLTYVYDDYAGGLRLIPRGVQFLDYTMGGPAYRPALAATDRGAADEIHGESGDDQIYGMKGNDVLFGDGQDDDLIGGYGDDWISGGTGDDAIIGDDGRISTSRNSDKGFTAPGVACTGPGTTAAPCYSEPLYGIQALLSSDPDTRTSQGNVLNEFIYTPGKVQTATINVAGALNRSVNLTPFNVDPNDIDPLFRPNGGYDDIIFGGLGDDAIHGGSGDDALSGAEALVEGYAPTYDPTCVGMTCLVRIDFGHPFNPGDVLRYNPDDVDGWHYDRTRRAGEFALYDEYDPRRAIRFNGDGDTWGCIGFIHGNHLCTGSPDYRDFPYQFFLNNTSDEGPTVLGCGGFLPNGTCTLPNTAARTDGNDIIFGDLGNDWLVGGTGNDTLWGGFGNDLLQADDNLSAGCLASTPNGTCTQTGITWLNDTPDTHPSYEDRAYGGAGRDVLIGNTGGDRLIDWIGEFNSYLVPFAPFGIATVSRQVPPALFEFLYVLSKAQGADPTRAADTNIASAPRNGEPNGEIGLVTQKDHGLWQNQSGAPADPQAGNIPGGKRDVLRSATFNDGTLTGFAPDSGVWEVVGGALNVAAASLGNDAAAVFYVDQTLPVYYEILASVLVQKPTAGWKGNAYVIFDYFSPTDFKFAGVDQSNNKVVLGHRTAQGWVVDVKGVVPGNVKFNTYYDLRVTVNGLVVTVFVDGTQRLSWQYDPRFIDGQAYGLNKGLAGVGSDNSRGTFDNFVVQALPPQTTFENTEDFSDGVADLFTGPSVGAWTISSGRSSGTPSGSTAATSIMNLPARAAGGTAVAFSSIVRVSSGGFGGLVFDYYADNDFKFVALDLVAQAVVIGHVVRGRWIVDASFAITLTAGVDYRLDLSLATTTVTVTLNGAAVGSATYNGAVADGGLGALSRTGATSFDDVHVAIGTQVSSSPDSQPPTLTVPANVTRAADSGQPTAFVSDAAIGTATATDNVPGVTVARSGVPAGNLFPIGVTAITWTATDVFGNQTIKTQTVTVNDTQNPILTVPPNVNRSTGGSSVTITDAELGAASASDNSGSFTIVRTGVPAGNIFSLGTTTITYTATDPSGNSTTNTQTVTVTSTSSTVSVSVVVTDGAGAEQASDPIVFTASRTGSTASSLAVSVVWGGSATFGSDYVVSVTGGSLSGSVLTFAAGSSSVLVTVTPVDDTVVEPTETVALTVAAGSGYTVGSPSVASGSIVDNDVGVSVVATDGSGAEQANDPIVFTVTRTGAIASGGTVNLVWGGSATYGADYTVSAAGATLAANGLTLTFAPGASSATVTVTPVDDTLVEPTETVTLTVAAGSGYTVGSPSVASGSIVDNDVNVSVVATDGSGAEQATDPIVFTVTRTGAIASGGTVNLVWGGSAAYGADYTVAADGATLAANGLTLTFAPGASSATVTATPVNDTAVEPTETVTLTVAAGSGYTVGSPASASGSIVDNDAPALPVVSVSSVSVVEGNKKAGAGTATATVTVTLSAASASTVSVSLTTVNGTATAGSDYSAVSRTLSFAPGLTSLTFAVSIIGDTKAEPNETFFVRVTAASGATGVGNQGTVTILNDDGAPLLASAAPARGRGGGAGALGSTARRGGGGGSAGLDPDGAVGRLQWCHGLGRRARRPRARGDRGQGGHDRRNRCRLGLDRQRRQDGPDDRRPARARPRPRLRPRGDGRAHERNARARRRLQARRRGTYARQGEERREEHEGNHLDRRDPAGASTGSQIPQVGAIPSGQRIVPRSKLRPTLRPRVTSRKSPQPLPHIG